MLSNLRKVMREAKDRGASAVEYGLIVAAIAALIVGIVFSLGTVVQNIFTNTCTQVDVAPAAGAGANPAADCK